ncbi:MAG: glycosyltransferase family 2 protein [Bacteroidales bacterium]|nr:glycosyltransferase family 2 protein [Bacteroidales bacterium]
MLTVKIIFWVLVFLVFYAYLGYGILLFVLVKLKRLFGLSREHKGEKDYEPEVTLFVAAYNEKDFVDRKVKNARQLNYPNDKLRQVWVTDGSDDGTPELLKQYPDVEVYHLPERNGKIGAMNRGIKLVESPIVVFSDANTDLGKDSIKEIVRLFRDPKVGCVSGEKRIQSKEKDTAAGAGEGIYWKYESMLKKWDAELYSVVGAAGELFAVRTKLFQEVERDTLLDDFIVSLRIAMQGYTIQYNPNAYALETASANVKEELKRKVRISAGGLQSIIRLKSLLNPFKHGILTFQYISHRVLRWTVAPFSLLVIFILNLIAALEAGLFTTTLYPILFWLQVVFYLLASLGWYLENRQIRLKVLFIPYYFLMMNYSVFQGLRRLIRKQQSVNWERAKRGK